MTTAAKPTATTTLPDPSGSYLTLIYPQTPTSQNNFMSLIGYCVPLTISLSGNMCTITVTDNGTDTVPYNQGNHPNSGNLQFALNLSQAYCRFNIDVLNRPGESLILQGTVQFTINSLTTTCDVRLLKPPISMPGGSYSVTAVNTLLNGTLTLAMDPSTNQPTGTYLLKGETNPTTIDPAPLWNTAGTPYQAMLTFTAMNYNFRAMYDPKWHPTGERMDHKFRGTAGSSFAGDDSDWTAQATVSEPEPTPTKP